LFVVKGLFLSFFLAVASHGAELDFMGTRINRDFENQRAHDPASSFLDQFTKPSNHLCPRGPRIQKVGLFRIGPMPQLVIEDMAVILPAGVDLDLRSSALDAFFQANPAWSGI
jgi:hypothetical protein